MKPPAAELRTDILTGRKVLVAEHRAQRPQQRVFRQLTYRADDDPFLRGHETRTPNEQLALRPVTSETDDDQWLLRVIPNRYPAIGPINSAANLPCEPSSETTHASGIHDVVVECPDGRSRLAELSVTEVARILMAWQLRLQQLSQFKEVQCITVFRNEGAGAGASIPHCHSQIAALSFVPEQVQQRLNVAVDFEDRTGTNLHEHWQNRELTDGRRIVDQTDDILTVCPFASRVSWHTRFVSTNRNDSKFSTMSEHRCLALANSVLRLVRAMDAAVGEFPHNILLHRPPHNAVCDSPWMLDLIPRSAGIAGFELMSDVDIVTVSPERSAATLREKLQAESTAPTDMICPTGYEWRDNANS